MMSIEPSVKPDKYTSTFCEPLWFVTSEFANFAKFDVTKLYSGADMVKAVILYIRENNLKERASKRGNFLVDDTLKKLFDIKDDELPYFKIGEQLKYHKMKKANEPSNDYKTTTVDSESENDSTSS